MAKILYVHNSANPGGMEFHVLSLVHGMVKKGHQVFVWCPPGTLVKEYRSAGATVSEKEIKADIDPLFILDLSFYIGREKIDIVHAHELKAVVNALLAAFLSGVKIRISHTHTPISTWRIGKIRKLLDVLFYSTFVNFLSTKEISLSESIREVKVREGIKNEKLVTIPNGIDFESLQVADDKRRAFKGKVFEKFKIPQGAFVIGNISRLTEEKGHEIALEAFSKVKDSGVVLLLAGGGRLTERIRGMAKRLGVAERTFITGFYEVHEKARYLSAIDLLVFPSLTEGFGYVPLEALAFGVPVVASDLPVLKETCRDDIFYFRVGDSEDLLDKLERLIANYDRAKEKTLAGSERVKAAFGLERFWDSYQKLYENSISRKG